MSKLTQHYVSFKHVQYWSSINPCSSWMLAQLWEHIHLLELTGNFLSWFMNLQSSVGIFTYTTDRNHLKQTISVIQHATTLCFSNIL